ncbi:hypothetical protein BJ912DRAFT_1152231 [Pholiota molesta]|nr:hypothetical protein BJ912DRAFT_1152231 [Pholiota molesta]
MAEPFGFVGGAGLIVLAPIVFLLSSPCLAVFGTSPSLLPIIPLSHPILPRPVPLLRSVHTSPSASTARPQRVIRVLELWPPAPRRKPPSPTATTSPARARDRVLALSLKSSRRHKHSHPPARVVIEQIDMQALYAMAQRRRRKDDAAIAWRVLPTYGPETSPPTYYKRHRRKTASTDKTHRRNTQPHLVALGRGQHPSFARKTNHLHQPPTCTTGSPHGDDLSSTPRPLRLHQPPARRRRRSYPPHRDLSISANLQPCTIGSTRDDDDPVLRPPRTVRAIARMFNACADPGAWSFTKTQYRRGRTASVRAVDDRFRVEAWCSTSREAELDASRRYLRELQFVVMNRHLPRPFQRFATHNPSISTAFASFKFTRRRTTTIRKSRAADDEIDDDGACRSRTRCMPSPMATLLDDLHPPLAPQRRRTRHPYRDLSISDNVQPCTISNASDDDDLTSQHRTPMPPQIRRLGNHNEPQSTTTSCEVPWATTSTDTGVRRRGRRVGLWADEIMALHHSPTTLRFRRRVLRFAGSGQPTTTTTIDDDRAPVKHTRRVPLPTTNLLDDDDSPIAGARQSVSRSSDRMGKTGTYEAEEQRARHERHQRVHGDSNVVSPLTAHGSSYPYLDEHPVAPSRCVVRPGRRRALRDGHWSIGSVALGGTDPLGCTYRRHIAHERSADRRVGLLPQDAGARGQAAMGGLDGEREGGSEDEDERVAGWTPPAPRGSLTNGERVLAGIVLFSLPVVLRSDPTCSTSSARCSDDIDNLDDLPNDGELVLKIPRRRRPSHLKGNIRRHDE